MTETAAASETARAPATAPWKRILTVCPSSWDEAQLAAARPRREGTYELLFHGQDAEDAQASFPLRALEDRRVLRVPGPAQLAEVRRRHPVSVVKVYCRPGHWLYEEGQSDGLTHRYGVVNMGGRSLESMLAAFTAVHQELGFAFERCRRRTSRPGTG